MALWGKKWCLQCWNRIWYGIPASWNEDWAKLANPPGYTYIKQHAAIHTKSGASQKTICRNPHQPLEQPKPFASTHAKTRKDPLREFGQFKFQKRPVSNSFLDACNSPAWAALLAKHWRKHNGKELFQGGGARGPQWSAFMPRIRKFTMPLATGHFMYIVYSMYMYFSVCVRVYTVK